MASIVFYVSGHGFGHATRILAAIRAQRKLSPENLEIFVRTQVPSWVFTDEDTGIVHSSASIDVGMLQPNGLDIDLPGSLAAHESFLSQWNQTLEREAGWLREVRPSLVVGDIPPMAFAAAGQAGIRSFAIGNFSWDWIAAYYAGKDPRWRLIAERYAAAYSRGGSIFRLPFHCPVSAFPKVTDTPLLVRRSGIDKASARRKLCLAPEERRKLVLISFGGYGTGALQADHSDELSDFIFIGFSAKPAGLRAEWIELPHRTPIPHVELLTACDAAIVKPGYGVFSELLARRIKALYLPRDNFPEVPFLIREFERLGCGRRIAHEDFYAGRWRKPLEQLISLPDRWEDIPLNGAEVIAEALDDALRS